MFNACDFVLIAALVFSAWLGWKLKGLPLLGATASAFLAPLAADHWQNSFAVFLIAKCHGHGLIPHQVGVAWALIATACVIAIMSVFVVLSKIAGQIGLSLFDSGLGSFLTVGLFLTTLGLQMAHWPPHLSESPRQALLRSWSWRHLRITQMPLWMEHLKQAFEALELPQKP